MLLLKNHYQHLCTYLQEKFVNGPEDEPVPVLKFIDLWNEQPNFPEMAEGYDYPALFVEYNANNLADLGKLSQEVKLQCSLYLCHVNYDDSFHQASAQEQALEYLHMLGRLHELLHGYSHPLTGTLRRVGMGKVGVQTNVIVYRLDFESSLIDDSGLVANRQTETVETDAEPEFVAPPPPEPKPNWFRVG
jgi:hypothetical protein